MSKNKSESLTGIFCLPTSTKFHMQDLEKSTAAAPNQFVYLLEAVDSPEEGGYPHQVVLTSNQDLNWDIDDIVSMQHAEVRKSLPVRRVVGMIFPDGEVDGILAAEGVGLPHWECISAQENGKPDRKEIMSVKMRILNRRNRLEEVKKARAKVFN